LRIRYNPLSKIEIFLNFNCPLLQSSSGSFQLCFHTCEPSNVQTPESPIISTSVVLALLGD
jgi:hypothetical protein